MKTRAWLQTKSLFISAGHDDSDPGAVANGYTEAQIVLEFRDLVASVLRREGLAFSKDGEREENLPLRDAARLASQHDVAVEFHTNAATPAASGAETLSRPGNFGKGAELTALISKVLDIPDRGAKPEDAGQHSRLAFVSQGGGIIVELFFLTNQRDLRRFREWQHELAEKVAMLLASWVCKPTQ